MFKNLTTTNIQLLRYGKHLLRDKFVGVFTRDKIPRLKRDEYCIINYDKAGNEGTHWVALCRNKDGTLLYFDSFGYTPLAGVNKAMFNDHRIQSILSSACGYFALRFLYLAHGGGDLYNIYYADYDLGDYGHNEDMINLFIKDVLRKKY